MAAPKLETACIAPRPPPTRLEQLNRLDENTKAYTPALQNLFTFILVTSLAAIVIVGAVALLLGSIGLALFLLYQGAKKAMNNA
ncbi:hypothetical protein V496_02364 [Pseudogymnoascus sp. VKM F-4515 (FW-2607)]|nr:hypothetical protein V496_02364 [Pseudogymnoascus sp. VKM F-4515 (FW-2607)]KFY97386.1 hypothetical protein V498_02094 [Pseudogymnoascus sp. VKM F-4517 (FW-2822)]